MFHVNALNSFIAGCIPEELNCLLLFISTKLVRFFFYDIRCATAFLCNAQCLLTVKCYSFADFEGNLLCYMISVVWGSIVLEIPVVVHLNSTNRSVI